MSKNRIFKIESFKKVISEFIQFRKKVLTLAIKNSMFVSGSKRGMYTLENKMRY